MRRRGIKKRKLTKSEQMARVRSKDTEPEITLRKALWRAGVRYRLRPTLPGTPDIAFLRQRIAIFVDGCFWHGCPEHYTRPVRNAEFWIGKVDRNVRRDRTADKRLSELGWKVVRVWEHEITQDVYAVVRRVRRLLSMDS